MGSKHPCDICHRSECEDCALIVCPTKHECCNYECFLNYEGSCSIGLYDECGAWED